VRKRSEAGAPAKLFESANAAPGASNDFEQLVERFFQVDLAAEYAALEPDLKLGEERTDYGSVLAALDRSEDNARRAHALYISSKVEQKRYEIEADKVSAAMRTEARLALQEEVEMGKRKGVISIAELGAEASRRHPDEYAAAAIKAEKIKRAADHLERFADLWKERCRTLSVVLQTMRK
jgi:hypothetical protein